MTTIEILISLTLVIIILLAVLFTDKFLLLFRKTYCVIIAAIFGISIVYDLSSKDIITEITNLKIIILSVSILLIFISIDLRKK